MTRQGDDFAAQAVLARLGRGSDAARRKAQLADELGWSEREVKRAVRALRMDGWLVLSGNEGYYLEGDPAAWLARQRSQIFSMWATYRAVRRTYRRQQAGNVEQTSLWDAA